MRCAIVGRCRAITDVVNLELARITSASPKQIVNVKRKRSYGDEKVLLGCQALFEKKGMWGGETKSSYCIPVVNSSKRSTGAR